MTLKFIKNSSNNRVFCDAVIRLILIETILGGCLDENTLIPSYSKYNFETLTGKHGGYNFVSIKDKINQKEFIYINEIILLGHSKKIKNFTDLKNFMHDKLGTNDDYINASVFPDNLEYTFKIIENKKKHKL